MSQRGRTRADKVGGRGRQHGGITLGESRTPRRKDVSRLSRLPAPVGGDVIATPPAPVFCMTRNQIFVTCEIKTSSHEIS